MPEGPFPAISKPSNHPTFSIGFAIRARVFITAFNPLGGAQSDEANKAAHAQLRENLREKAPLLIERSGTDPTGHWSAEKSYFALGMNEEAARILGKLWHQDAVVWVGRRRRSKFDPPAVNSDGVVVHAARGAPSLVVAATGLEVLDLAPGEGLRDFRPALRRLAQDLRQLRSLGRYCSLSLRLGLLMGRSEGRAGEP